MRKVSPTIGATPHGQQETIVQPSPDAPVPHVVYLSATIESLTAENATLRYERERLESQVMARDAELWGRTQEILSLRAECERLRAELDAAHARARAATNFLRQHAISHDPTTRPMLSTCNICDARWGGDDAESHGSGCPFYIDAAREGK